MAQVSWLLVFLLGLLYQPAKLHQKQLDEIKKFKGEGDVIASPLIITAYEDEQYHTTIGIKIENPRSQKVTHLSVRLENLVRVKGNGEREPRAINEANRGFPGGADFHEPGAILPRGDVIVFVAEATDNAYAFLLGSKQDYGYPNDAVQGEVRAIDFEMKLSICGFIDERQLQTRYFKAAVHFETNRNGSFARITSLEELSLSNKQSKKAIQPKSDPVFTKNDSLQALKKATLRVLKVSRGKRKRKTSG